MKGPVQSYFTVALCARLYQSQGHRLIVPCWHHFTPEGGNCFNNHTNKSVLPLDWTFRDNVHLVLAKMILFKKSGALTSRFTSQNGVSIPISSLKGGSSFKIKWAEIFLYVPLLNLICSLGKIIKGRPFKKKTEPSLKVAKLQWSYTPTYSNMSLHFLFRKKKKRISSVGNAEKDSV